MANVVNQSDTKAPNFIWDGLYPTWETASDAANAVENRGGEGFSSGRWLQRITQQLSDYKNEFQKYGVAIPPRPCNLPLICAMTNPSTIIDFGGSSGWSWEYLKNTLSDQAINSYVIVETELVVEHMKTSEAHGAPVRYKTQGETMERCDLLYCNSVLQYFSSNDPLLSLVRKAEPSYIFLEDCIAKGDKDFFSTQKYYGSSIPHRFIGMNKLLKELNGYEEVVKYPYSAPILGVIAPLEMGNFPAANRIRYAWSILLKKLERQ
jgi:putative methyltransferase (TIGR04325 family)